MLGALCPAIIIAIVIIVYLLLGCRVPCGDLLAPNRGSPCPSLLYLTKGGNVPPIWGENVSPKCCVEEQALLWLVYSYAFTFSRWPRDE